MPLLRHLQNKAGQFAFNSFLYDWSLRGRPQTDRLIVRPVDPWPGDAQAGTHLCEGVFSLGAEHLTLRGHCWEPFGVDEAWIAHMHGFTWLRDLRALAAQKGHSKICRAQARAMILAWIDRYDRWHALPWRGDIMGERLAMWIALYEFFNHDTMNDDEDEEFHDLFFDSLGRQALHLFRILGNDGSSGVAILKAAKGLLYAGLAIEGQDYWAVHALEILKREIDKQILGDGAHVSRNPEALLYTLQILLDVRDALSAAGYPPQESVQHAIDRMGPALRFFRHHDKGFALFNGTQEGSAAFTDSVLAQSAVKGRTLESLPCAGYERVEMGRSLLIFDCGPSPTQPNDAQAHAAPLSFEMSYAKERIFVNCGTHPHDPAWQDALRATAAHNALVIDNRNACEIRDNGHMARKARKVTLMREGSRGTVGGDQACLLEATHDGYERLNGFIHRRKLYLSEQGHDLRGEDTLSAAIDPVHAHDFAVRFHLHPRVNLSLINGGTEALLRLRNGVGWRFKHVGGTLVLEDSVYLGQDAQPRKTKQLAIYSQSIEKEVKIKWALCKEG